MTTIETNGDDGGDLRSRGKLALLAVALFLGLVVATHLGWNLFAPDLFDVPRIRFKGAMGLVLLAGALGLTLRLSAGRSGRR